jgi:DNA-binding NtrC family response regulator
MSADAADAALSESRAAAAEAAAERLISNDTTHESSSDAPSEVRRARGQEFEIILNDLSDGAPFSDADRLITVDELERRYIERVLTLTSGNKSRAAQILGFDRRTLYRKIERYGRSQ